MPLAKGAPDFNPCDRTAGRPKRFEAEHRVREAFHRPLVLLDDVIKIFRVANDNGGLVSLVVVRDRCRVAATLIDHDLLREPLVPNRFA